MANYSNNWVHTKKSDDRTDALIALKKAKDLERLKLEEKKKSEKK